MSTPVPSGRPFLAEHPPEPSPHDAAGVPATAAEAPDPMQMLALLLLIHGFMQPLMHTLGMPSAAEPAPGSDEPSDSVVHLLSLLLMESFLASVGDPFAIESPDGAERPCGG